jgi:hypothetical protein
VIGQGNDGGIAALKTAPVYKGAGVYNRTILLRATYSELVNRIELQNNYAVFGSMDCRHSTAGSSRLVIQSIQASMLRP